MAMADAQAARVQRYLGAPLEIGYEALDASRDDLGGVDVARKALILARTLGMRAEMAEVELEPLCPPELARLSVDQFMAALPSLDEGFAARVAAAAADGRVLRYVATVRPPTRGGTRGRLTVGLAGVPLSSPQPGDSPTRRGSSSSESSESSYSNSSDASATSGQPSSAAFSSGRM